MKNKITLEPDRFYLKEEGLIRGPHSFKDYRLINIRVSKLVEGTPVGEKITSKIIYKNIDDSFINAAIMGYGLWIIY